VFPFLRYAVLSAVLACAALLLVGPTTASADEKAPTDKEIKEVRDKAIAYLRKRQATDGGFSAKFGPGITALVIAALIRNDVPSDNEMLKKALNYLSKSVKKDGGIYAKGLQNYTTCVAIMAFKEANTGGKYDTIIKKASEYLRKLQYDDPANKDLKLGGLGYGDQKSRPDLSNTQYFVEAMIAAGVPKDDPALKRALKFISRCQNLADKEKGNDQVFATKAKEGDKGGLTYTPLDPEDSPHATGDGGLRSLGAMTYAGLKSFLYAGVKKDDPRLQAAVKWMRAHYTLEENTGQGQAGLYYYYSTFAKAMEAYGDEPFKDAKGKEHYWRKELYEALKKRQQKDGNFINKGDKTFGEADPNLATAFALLSLSYTRAKK
jgi:squalene-hopene/tetraprenyl-beta-curcumene cyclase